MPYQAFAANSRACPSLMTASRIIVSTEWATYLPCVYTGIQVHSSSCIASPFLLSSLTTIPQMNGPEKGSFSSFFAFLSTRNSFHRFPAKVVLPPTCIFPKKNVEAHSWRNDSGSGGKGERKEGSCFLPLLFLWVGMWGVGSRPPRDKCFWRGGSPQEE